MAKWCNARSQMENISPCYTVGGAIYKTGENSTVACNFAVNGYRLPTEAEWEKAARGGAVGKNFPWGTDTISHDQANFWNDGVQTYQSGTTGPHPLWSNNNDENFPYSSPVGSFEPNGYGLYDMAGNMCEWCWDWYMGSYTAGALTDPQGPASGYYRAARGGSWSFNANYARCAFRSGGRPDVADFNIIGFRVARSTVP